MPADAARLFIALWPQRALREGLAAWCRTCSWPDGARPTPVVQLHLTLHFLGAVPRTRLAALQQALRLPFAPFVLSLGRPVLWQGGLAVLEPAAVPQRLLELHGALGRVLQDLGLNVESRPYRPHLTIARHAQRAVLPPAGPALRWPVRGYALVESRPPPHGGYQVLQRWP